MRVIARHRTGIKRAVMGVVLVPFLLLSLFASGTMLARVSGEVAIVICVGDTLVTRFVPGDQAPPGKTPDHAASECPWDEALRTALDGLPQTEASAPTTVTALWLGRRSAQDLASAPLRHGTIRAPPQAA